MQGYSWGMVWEYKWVRVVYPWVPMNTVLIRCAIHPSLHTYPPQSSQSSYLVTRFI